MLLDCAAVWSLSANPVHYDIKTPITETTRTAFPHQSIIELVFSLFCSSCFFTSFSLNICSQQQRSSSSLPNTQQTSFYFNRCGCLVTGRMPAEPLGASCSVCLVVFRDGIFTSWTSTVSSCLQHSSACYCLLYTARACGQRQGVVLIYTRWWFHKFLTHLISLW